MRRILAVLLTATSIVLAGCGKDAIGPAQVAGTYTLQTVNGQPLPYTLGEDATSKTEILSQTFTLNVDATYSWVTTDRLTDNGQVTTDTDTSTGTYTVRGSTITIRDVEGGSLDVMLTGDTLTMIIGPLFFGIILEFRR